MTDHQILTPANHGDLRVHTGAGAQFGDAVMASLIVPLEFRAVQAHYPIVFRRDAASGRFAALALFGFDNGENLFLDGDRWDARYRPLAMAIQPFLIGRPPAGSDTPQVHVDMAHPRIAHGQDGSALFDQNGRPTPLLEAAAGKVGDLDHGYRQCPAFFAALERHDLLEPFTLDVPLDNGARHSLVGYHVIAEDRLAALDGGALGELQLEGHLLPIFMAVASLGRFADLVARKNARIALG